jgi:alkylation response protein AidB-like acyl-CoA dehydrogenase
MAAIRPRDLLTDSLLERLGGTAPGVGLAPAVVGDHDPSARAILSRDIAKLASAGYLNVALPPEFGGLGCTLRQAACGQRRLARRAPRTALAVSAHLYWTGAAADAYRAGDDSVRWILLEAARGALFASGHGTAGGDLQFADPRSRCEPAGESGYRFRDSAVLSSLTPATAWDWVAVHAVHTREAVLAFAGRGSRCTPAFRVARVQPAGTVADVFTASAVGWGHSVLASVQYSDARRAFNAAVAAAAEANPDPGQTSGSVRAGGHPLDTWPVAEAGLRLDAMKAKIAEITHPWPLVPEHAPDPGGQRLIGIYTMRHEVADGARHVQQLIRQIAEAQAVAAL